MIKAEILVPLLNANEPEARLVGIHVKEGQAVEKGALLCTLETTKAAADIESSEAGFVRVLASEGDTLSVGDKLALITETGEQVGAPLPLTRVAQQLYGAAQAAGHAGDDLAAVVRALERLTEPQ